MIAHFFLLLRGFFLCEVELGGEGFESRWAHLPRFRDIPATRPFFVFLCITGFTQGFAFEPKKLGPSRNPSDCPAENQTDAGSENRIAARELMNLL